MWISSPSTPSLPALLEKRNNGEGEGEGRGSVVNQIRIHCSLMIGFSLCGFRARVLIQCRGPEAQVGALSGVKCKG